MTPLRLVMMGAGTFAEPTFEALLRGPHPVVGLVTQPDRPTRGSGPLTKVRGSTRQTGKGMKAIAVEHGVPVRQPVSVNTPEGVEALRELRPDLLVVAAYGQILKGHVLDCAPRGGINVHASLLPRYRGAAPVAWAIYHGEAETGVTIIRMNTSLDAGDMLARQATPIDPHETAGELEARLAVLGAGLAVEVIDRLARASGRPSGTASDSSGERQDLALVTRAPKLCKEDGLLDWSRPARDVVNQVRAMQPWPTPYSFLQRQGHPPLRIIITRAAWQQAAGPCPLPPGQVVVDPTAPERLVVAAGQGTRLEVVELQPAGKRRMAHAEFLRGHPVRPGDHFGPEAP